MGEGSFRCSLYLSPKVLEVSPIYWSSQERSPYWNQYMAPLLLTIGSLSWGRPVGSWCYYYLWSGSVCHTSHRSFCDPWFQLHWVAGRAPAVPWLLASSETSLDGLLSLFSTLSKAHLGYLNWVSAFLRWTFSFWRRSGLLHTVWALWVRVWITLNFAERWWWLSHCRYWSMWVGFLYTVIDRVPSASGFTMVSKKGWQHPPYCSPL